MTPEMNPGQVAQSATWLVELLKPIWPIIVGGGALLAPFLPKLWAILTARETRELVLLVGEVGLIAASHARDAMRVRAAKARAPGSPGGETITAEEREEIIEDGVMAVWQVLEERNLLSRVLAIYLPAAYGDLGGARALLRAAIREKTRAELEDIPPAPAPADELPPHGAPGTRSAQTIPKRHKEVGSP